MGRQTSNKSCTLILKKGSVSKCGSFSYPTDHLVTLTTRLGIAVLKYSKCFIGLPHPEKEQRKCLSLISVIFQTPWCQIWRKSETWIPTNLHRKPFSDRCHSIIRYCGSAAHCGVTVQPHGGACTTARNTVLYTAAMDFRASSWVFVCGKFPPECTSHFDLPKPFRPPTPPPPPPPLTCVSSISICPVLHSVGLRNWDTTRWKLLYQGQSCIFTLTFQVYTYVGLLKEEL